jgi:hypothetical protein
MTLFVNVLKLHHDVRHYLRVPPRPLFPSLDFLSFKVKYSCLRCLGIVAICLQSLCHYGREL